MPTNQLTHPSGVPYVEEYERDELGHCSCGEPVRKIYGSSATANRDRIRYAKLTDTAGWSMFRCPKCLSVIADSFQLIQEESMEITAQHIITMLHLQDKMNSTVNPEWRSAGNAWMRAVMVETVEGIEHYGWKWWKAQVPDMPQARMEMVDAWHFILSKMIENHSAFCSDDELAEYVMSRADSVCNLVYYNSKTYQPTQSLLEDFDLMVEMAAAGQFSIRLFSNILCKLGMSWGDLFRMYLSKNALNIFRQANGYKTGGYKKDWSCVPLDVPLVESRALEDNDHLHDLMAKMDFSTEGVFDRLQDALQARYERVCSH